MLKLAGTFEPEQIRLSEVVSALSYSLDIVEGQPEGHAIRSCLIGMRLAKEIGLASELRSSLFYALLLKDLGCSSNAAKISYLFGASDQKVKQDFKTTNWQSLLDSAKYVARNVVPGGTIKEKICAFCRVSFAGDTGAKEVIKLRCERGAQIARHLEFSEDTVQAIRNLDEHWDGKGHPDQLKKEQIPLLARILGLAQTVEVFLRRDGLDGAMQMAKSRSRTWFDPSLVRALLSIREDHEFWAMVCHEHPRQFIDSFEPADQVKTADADRLDQVAEAFGMVIDAKSPWTACHSRGVRDVAVGIAKVMGLDAHEVRGLSRAGLLHDIGKLGIPNTILDKPGKLTDFEFDEMKVHPAYTLRILERVACFREISELAASHHERLDGKGYFRGLDASQLSTPVRILAVADMYEALSAKRPYRKDLSEEEVYTIVGKHVGPGVCPEVFAALKVFVDKSGFVPYVLAA